MEEDFKYLISAGKEYFQSIDLGRGMCVCVCAFCLQPENADVNLEIIYGKGTRISNLVASCSSIQLPVLASGL